MLNENKSCVGIARWVRIHSPARTWTPVSGSFSKAEGPPNCQYSRTAGRRKASEVREGTQRKPTLVGAPSIETLSALAEVPRILSFLIEGTAGHVVSFGLLFAGRRASAGPLSDCASLLAV